MRVRYRGLALPGIMAFLLMTGGGAASVHAAGRLRSDLAASEGLLIAELAQGPAENADPAAPVATEDAEAALPVDVPAAAEALIEDLAADAPAATEEETGATVPADLGAEPAAPAVELPADLGTPPAEAAVPEEEAVELPADLGDLIVSPAEEMPTPADVATPPAEPSAEAPEEPATPAEPALTGGAREMAEQLSEIQRVRLQAQEESGRRAYADAMKAYRSGDYGAAAAKFQEAFSKIPAREATEDIRKRAAQLFSESEYRVALGIVRSGGDLDQALNALANAIRITPEDDRLAKLKTRIEMMQRAQEAPPKPRPPYADENVEKRQQIVQELLVEGKGFMGMQDLPAARSRFEAVLALEPDNEVAMRYLKQLGGREYDANTMERTATVEGMMAQVREAWNPRRYAAVKPEERGGKPAPPPVNRLREKMARIIIPEIEFRAANIHDVVEFLVNASREGDTEEADVARRGVNIILNLQPGGGGRAVTTTATPGPFDVGLPESVADLTVVPEITFTARYITLLQALDTVTKVAGLKYLIEENLVMIVPKDYYSGDMVTKMYPVEPIFLDQVRSMPTVSRLARGGTPTSPFESEPTTEEGIPDLRPFFEALGVPFPPGSSVAYNPAIGKVIVANTPENLAKFEALLPDLNVLPKQVEIEARFVEVKQRDLQELGLEWLLTDDWEMFYKGDSRLTPPLGGRERVQMNANDARGGFTRGLRFVGQDAAGELAGLANGQGDSGSILSISSLLTNPELTVVLHALEMSGHADVLSAPKVTTRSGNEASIRVVTEYIYPTEFRVEGGDVAAGGGVGGNVVTEPYVVPDAFEMREVGVILVVTPEVSPEGNMINLTLTPEVVDEPVWYQYGSTIQRADGSTLDLNIPQPFFFTRNISTAISIWDGATVVMGGMIVERLDTVDDKVPFLGDIPLLGMLFRSKSKISDKANLLIFVTARLVDPGGDPIRKPKTAETAAAAAGVGVASAE